MIPTCFWPTITYLISRNHGSLLFHSFRFPIPQVKNSPGDAVKRGATDFVANPPPPSARSAEVGLQESTRSGRTGVSPNAPTPRLEAHAKPPGQLRTLRFFAAKIPCCPSGLNHAARRRFAPAGLAPNRGGTSRRLTFSPTWIKQPRPRYSRTHQGSGRAVAPSKTTNTARPPLSSRPTNPARQGSWFRLRPPPRQMANAPTRADSPFSIRLTSVSKYQARPIALASSPATTTTAI